VVKWAQQEEEALRQSSVVLSITRDAISHAENVVIINHVTAKIEQLFGDGS